MLLPSEAKHALTGNSEKKPLSTLPYKETAVRGTSATVKHDYVFYDTGAHFVVILNAYQLVTQSKLLLIC